MLETLIQPIFTSLSLMDSMQSLVVGSYGILGQTTTQVAESVKAAEVAANNWKGFYDVGLFLFAVIVPFVLGKFFSSRLKMPSHAMAFRHTK